MSPKTLIVGEGEAGRLDQVLTSLLLQEVGENESLSRSQLKKRIDQGLVSVNGITATKAGCEVIEGDEIVIESDDDSTISSLAPYEFELPVLFEDECLLVLNKPAGITVHPGAGTGNETVLNALIWSKAIEPERFSGSGRPGIVHRLDKNTSGVMVVAKSQQMLTNLSHQFQERTTHKEYIALALRKERGGTPFDLADTGTIQYPLGRDPKNPLRMAIVPKGKSANTEWRVLERFRHAVLLEIIITTGRTHQIRVHLEAIGSGVIGDSEYGNFDTLPKALVSTALTLGRQALHAKLLSFDHPKTGERMSIEAPIPDDMKSCIERFRE